MQVPFSLGELITLMGLIITALISVITIKNQTQSTATKLDDQTRSLEKRFDHIDTRMEELRQEVEDIHIRTTRLETVHELKNVVLRTTPPRKKTK